MRPPPLPSGYHQRSSATDFQSKSDWGDSLQLRRDDSTSLSHHSSFGPTYQPFSKFAGHDLPTTPYTTPFTSSVSSAPSCNDVCTDPTCNAWDTCSIHQSDTCTLKSCLSSDLCESSACCREEECIRESETDFECGHSCLNDERLESDDFSDLLNYDLENINEPMPCQWLETAPQCPVSASPAALSLHVTKGHIDPNAWLPCGWNQCEQTVDSQHIVEHVSQEHRPDQYVCLWQGCGWSFSSGEELSNHMSTMHTTKWDCHWGGCDFTLEDQDSLKAHINDEHFNFNPDFDSDFHHDNIPECQPFPPLTSPELQVGQQPQPDLAEAKDLAAHTCQWMEKSSANKICGAPFHHENDLQDHVEKAHVNGMHERKHEPQCGPYVCNWRGCSIQGMPHNGKHRLRKHMWTHTGCR